MKVLHVVWGFSTGGIETMLVNIVNEQVYLGYKVGLLVLSDLINESLKEMISKEVLFISIKRPPRSRNPYYIYKYNRCYWKFCADIVHFHDITLSKRIYLKRASDKWICTIHTNKLIENVQSYVDSRISYYLAISKIVQSLISKFISPLKIKLCYNAINVNEICFRTDVRFSVMNFVCVSRMIFSLKGQDVLIRAFKLLKDLGYSNLHIDIYGDGCDYSKAKQLISNMHLFDMVSLKGDLQHSILLEKLFIYDVIIQPSIYEGFGLTILEGLSSNIITMGSNIDAIKEIASLGAPIVLFESNNVNDLVDKIIKIVSSPTMYYKEALRGRKFVNDNFSTFRQVKELSEVMNSLVKS